MQICSDRDWLLIAIAYVVTVQRSESSSWIHIKSNLFKISDLDGYVVELLLDSAHSISNWGSPAHLLAFGLAWCSQGPKVKTKQFRAPRPWGHGAMPTFAWRYFEHVELYLQFTSSYCGWGNTPRHCILFVFIVFMVFAIVIIVVIISIRSFSTSLHLPFLYFDYIFPSNAEFDAFSAWLMRTSSRQRTCTVFMLPHIFSAGMFQVLFLSLSNHFANLLIDALWAILWHP